jgi:hypothetical protein
VFPRSLAVCAIISLIVPAADAAQVSDVPGAIGKCVVVQENAARLACYDKLAAQLALPAMPQVAAQPALAVPSAPLPPSQTAAAAPPLPSASASQRESWFGIADWFGSDHASPALQTSPQLFGSENLPLPPPSGEAPAQSLDSITAVATDVAFNALGRFTVFLDNGQIWQQLSSDPDTARFPHGDKAKVTISRGALGSYNLQIEGLTRAFKVKRVK